LSTGLANKKTVTIQAGDKDQAVVLATSKTKKQNKPAALFHKSVMKKEFRRMAKAVENQVIIGLSSSCNAFRVCY
jgi:large subunit ribosomal protein L28e